MRVVLNTNILVSALLLQQGHPAAIYRAWQEGNFTLLTCAGQLDELRATLRKPAIAERIKPFNLETVHLVQGRNSGARPNSLRVQREGTAPKRGESCRTRRTVRSPCPAK